MLSLCRRIGYSVDASNEIVDVYNAVKVTNNAAYMKDPETPKIGGGGFVFCEDPELNEIKRNLKIRDGSGSSLAFSLRNVQHLLKDYEDFVTRNFIYFEKEKFGTWDLSGRTRRALSQENTMNVLKSDLKLQLLGDSMI